MCATSTHAPTVVPAEFRVRVRVKVRVRVSPPLPFTRPTTLRNSKTEAPSRLSSTWLRVGLRVRLGGWGWG